MKFIIKPVTNAVMEIEATDKEEAMAIFAAKIDSDMNSYFKAVPENHELHELLDRMQEKFDEHKEFVTNFMQDELSGTYGVPEESLEAVANRAFEIHCDESLGEQDAIREAYERYKKEDIEFLKKTAQDIEALKSFHGEIEIGIFEDNIEIREYIEEEDSAFVRNTVGKGCITEEDIQEICNECGWYAA